MKNNKQNTNSKLRSILNTPKQNTYNSLSRNDKVNVIHKLDDETIDLMLLIYIYFVIFMFIFVFVIILSDDKNLNKYRFKGDINQGDINQRDNLSLWGRLMNWLWGPSVQLQSTSRICIQDNKEEEEDSKPKTCSQINNEWGLSNDNTQVHDNQEEANADINESNVQFDEAKQCLLN